MFRSGVRYKENYILIITSFFKKEKSPIVSSFGNQVLNVESLNYFKMRNVYD